MWIPSVEEEKEKIIYFLFLFIPSTPDFMLWFPGPECIDNLKKVKLESWQGTCRRFRVKA